MAGSPVFGLDLLLRRRSVSPPPTAHMIPVTATTSFSVGSSSAVAVTRNIIVSVLPLRARQGDLISVHFAAAETPAVSPVITVKNGLGGTVFSFLAALSSKPLNFARYFRMSFGAALGTYSVSVAFTGLTGNKYVGVGSFTLVGGGDNGGAVVSMFVSERPEGSKMIAQLDSGRLVQGDNPHL